MSNYKVIYSNEFLSMHIESGNIYIVTNTRGFDLEQFKTILIDYPVIEIEDFETLRKVLNHESQNPQKIGRLKERISLIISENGMMATVLFNLTKEELDTDNREKLIKDTAIKLREKGITFGIKSEMFTEELISGKEYIIAEGQSVVDGIDSVVKMYEFEVPKPEAIEKDKVDYYEVSLIPTVEANTWLGERIEAIEGIPGKTVTGMTIKPKKGVTFPLNYDGKMVQEVSEAGKSVLYSKVYGAVYYKGKDISLMNPLIIDGDVDMKTGNIVFDGHVIINGTISDGFYVEATKDIEVNGEIGLGNIKGIVSKEGSIFIKGGVLCKGNTKIQAAKNVYIKFVDNVTVDCGETAHFGFYCSNSTVIAREVIVDSPKGQIKGCNIKAEARVVSPFIGSELGIRTVVEVSGFNKSAITNEVMTYNNNIKELKKEYDTAKQNFTYYSQLSNISDFQYRLCLNYQDRLAEIKEEIGVLSETIKNFECFLSTRGDGEINTKMRIYPNTCFTIKKKTVEIKETIFSTTYFVQDAKLLKV